MPATGGNSVTLHCYVNNLGAGDANVYMALYSDDAANNLPANRLAAAVTIVKATGGPAEASGTFEVALAANTPYWIVFVTAANLEMYYMATGAGDSGYYNIGSTTLPDDFGDSAASDRTWEYVMWVTYNESGGAVPVKAATIRRRRS
ncbi:MAG: hypothetical protein WC683_07865 [bacterium]